MDHGPVCYPEGQRGKKRHQALGSRPFGARLADDDSENDWITDNRIGTAEFTVPPQTKGPPPHWHEMVSIILEAIKG